MKLDELARSARQYPATAFLAGPIRRREPGLSAHETWAGRLSNDLDQLAGGQAARKPPREVESGRPESAGTIEDQGSSKHVSAEELEEMGPIDYLIIEWPDRQPSGEAAPLLADLVDRGLIRIIDLAFIAKGEDGSVTMLDIAGLADESHPLGELVGASSGLLSEEDAEEAATALESGRSAAVLVYENLWAAPFAVALRRSGAQLVANGRIPVQAILAALDASEGSEPTPH